MNKFRMVGRFDIKCYGPDGNLKWEDSNFNCVTNLGLNHMLDTQFHASTQVTTWYIILKDGGVTNVADTLASNSWNEVTAYASATRPAWTEGAASNKIITNAVAVSFAMNGSVTVGGAGLVSSATKSETASVLFSIEEFNEGDKSVGDGDTLDVTYTLTGADQA